MAIALALVFIAVGSVLFHVLSPWWQTPIASNWRYIDDTITIRSGSLAPFSSRLCCSWLIACCGSVIGLKAGPHMSLKTKSSRLGSP